MARLGPSGLAQLFREIANYVSERLSNYRTKAELDTILDTKADDNNVIHTSGNETIHGVKIFNKTISRHADLTTSTVEQVYNFYDINTNSCGHIYNNVHWHDNAVFNRHGAYNAKSGKSMEIDIISNDSGVGMLYVAGTANKGNLETVTSETGHTGIATMGWVNNPATSTNVVHRSGDETIAGNKTFTEEIRKKNSALDLQVNPSSVQYNSFLFTDKNDVVMAYLEHIQTTTGVNALGLIARDKNNGSRGIQVTSENNVIPLEDGVVNLGLSGSKWKNVYSNRVSFPSGYYITTDTNDNSLRIIRDGTGHGNNYKVIIQGDTGKFYAPNGFIGNLQGNADTATSAGSATKSSYLDNYSHPNGNKIYLDWDIQKKDYVGLKVDNTVMGGLITTSNLCSTFANAIRFGGVGCIKLLAFEWDGYNTSAYSLQEGATYAGANLRHIVMSVSGFSTIPNGSNTIYDYGSKIYLGTRPTGTWSLLSSFNAFNRSYHPDTCIGLFVRIA